MDTTLRHHGVKGMKWGVRRKPKRLEKKKKIKENIAVPGKKTKSLKELSDDELRSRISRLEMEKKYKDLMRSDNQIKVSKGKAFVMDVLEKSGKNIATQTVTYVLGTGVNKAAGKEIVNPKKGQKDK